MKSLIINLRHKLGIIIAVILILILCLCGCNANNKIDKSTDNLKEYELNGVIFSMPEFWVLESEDEESMTFSITNSDKGNMVMVRSKTIPDIMKIDVGENSILTKTDVVNNYAVYQTVDCSVEEKQWLTTDNFDYFKAIFSDIKMSDGSTQSGASITIPINENEAVFDITIISDDKDDLKLIDKILNSVTININSTPSVSIAEQIYTEAITATKDDLTGDKGKYYYKGIQLLSDDCEWIDNPINKEGTVSQGVIYRKMAKVLWGSDWENKRFLYSYTNISDLLLGFTPETVDDYIPLGKNASEFIVEKDQLKAIMAKLEKMNSVQGDFDFEYGKFGKFNLDISDLSVCAKEMQISDEMLGYIFAMLDEYGTKITFSGNSCHIEYTSYS